MKKQDIIILSVLLIALVLVRVIFNIPNFNPVGAIALMGGLLFGNKILAYLIPLGALFVGDILMGLSSPMYMEYILSPSFLMVYGSFAAIITLGILLNRKPSLSKVLGGSILAAVLFFLITNAGAWATLPEYPKTLDGLALSYKAGLPFFRSTLVSQVVFSLGIYLVYSLSTNRKLALA
ncbi:MAG: hypothetical protein COA58_03155 [Bacteroidetes bacterium]|nr:MAG: hypothetical protein COA58_03155 [Bacteroidota bacterium]